MTTLQPTLRAALIQVRQHAAAEAQEQRCFLARCGFRPEQLRCFNAVREPLDWHQIADADVLFVGGAGEFSVTQKEPFMASLSAIVERWIEDRRPFLGSCWGHQLLAVLAGGQVVTDPSREEIGTLPIFLTAAGRRDPVFAGMPERFEVHLGHHDRVSELPAGALELAASERCPNQVFRLGDRPAYGTQFHSEMSRADMRARLEIYREGYLRPGQEIDDLVAPTPEAETLLERFLAAWT